MWNNLDVTAGPFEITNIEEVPDNARSCVGHPQWLTIVNAGDELIGERFSGMYFTPLL